MVKLLNPLLLALLLLPTASIAQVSGSSSSNPDAISLQHESSSSAPRTLTEPGGAAITLETSEPMFYLAAALNVCGYDAGLDHSSPVRAKVRADLTEALAASAPARETRDALCTYISQHRLSDPGQDLAQYVSLALYLSPPPELSPTVGETDLPPDSTQVLGILPLLRNFAEAVHLHPLWIEHRTEYEAMVDKVHEPLTHMILDTNIYLRQPVSSYDGRHFVVVLEPMLAPSQANARLYGSDFYVITSPESSGTVRMDEVRHTYLHYEIEPLVYARAAAMDRLLPLLRAVREAPLDFSYKADIVSLLAECLIKAIEARTMDVGLAKPQRPTVVHERADLEHYDAAISVYDREAEATRRALVERDMRQGWVLTDYFYNQLVKMEKTSISLKETIGPMIYGMDVDGERKRDQQIVFFPQGSQDVVRRAPRQLIGMDLAEMKLMKGDSEGAEQIAQKTLAEPNGDRGQAHYLLARLALMQSDPDEAIAHFEQALQLSHDPHTVAWSHVYLGRLYDTQPDRPKAIEQYRAALAVRDAHPDTQAAAQAGLQHPFALPKRPQPSAQDDSPVDSTGAPLDPSGKAEKNAYRPDSSQ